MGPSGRERLIVALDVPTAEAAFDLVERLGEVVSFYKIGWQLFMTGQLPQLLERMRDEGKKVFLDLKVPGDIGNTIRSVVEACVANDVRFLTMSSDFVPVAAIEAAKQARGGGLHPKLLMVPFLSSLDHADLQRFGGGEADLDTFILGRAKYALEAGCDGLIVSGSAIGLVRKAHPEAILVSPGIRPEGSTTDDHKRSTTPAEAIGMGADYLVVGRPIRNAPDPAEAARRVIEEIDRTLENRVHLP